MLVTHPKSLIVKGFLRWILTSLGALALFTGVSDAAAADAADVERTMAIVELRSGETADPLTSKYLEEVLAAFKDEGVGDIILVDGKTTADKVRKDREQVPSALTEDRRAQLAEARKRGIDLLDNADFQGAIKALVLAEGRYRGALASPGADNKLRAEYLDLLAQLATAYVAAGDKPAATDVFRTVITTFGLKASITDDNYRPDVVALFVAEVKKVEKMPMGSVEVTSTPAGAHIILGGNDRGITPATVADLIPGNYGVRLQSGEGSSMLRKVKVEGGGTARFSADIAYESHLALVDDRVALMYTDLKTAEARLQSDAAAIGRDVEVNLVCVVGVIDGKLASFLVDVAGNRIVRYATDVKVPKVGISKRAVNKVIVTILGEKADKNVAEGPAPAGGGHAWYKSTPGLIAAGGAVVALGVGIALSSYLNLDNLNYCAESGSPCKGLTDSQVRASPGFQDFESSAGTKQIISGVGLGAGVALAGVAGWLFYSEANRTDAAQAILPAGTVSPQAALVDLPPLSLASGPQRFLAR